MKQLKVDFTKVLMTLDGKPLKERSDLNTVRAALMEAGMAPMVVDTGMALLRPLWAGGEPKEVVLTAQAACMAALQAPEQSLTGAERVTRMRLALKLLDPVQPVEVNEQEKEAILKAIEKAYASPVVYYRINELFESAIVERDRPLQVAAG